MVTPLFFKHVVAGLLVVLGSLVVATWPAQAEEPAAPLGRSIEKLKKDKRLTIGYLGGSITAGVGASDESRTSWRALTTAWFKQRFPDAAIKEANAAIARTGSDFGAFRYPADLLAQDPDLIFVEFAVDDRDNSELRVKRSVEGIVRQIWQANPWAEIVFIYTTTKAQSLAYAQGKVPTAVASSQAIARHYDVSEINAGQALSDHIKSGAGTWETLTVDGVHPNDAGYAVYMQSIRAFLESHLNDQPGAPRTAMPVPLTEDPFSGTQLVDATMLFVPGWEKEEKSLGGQYPHYIASNATGTDLSFKFPGTTIGLYWLMSPDGGDVEWSIDGGEAKRLSSWDQATTNGARASYVIFADDLSSGEHTLKITILADKAAGSRGTWIRIGAFLVHCPC